MKPKEKSCWGLCLSCERIQNRLFLEAIQLAIREGRQSFEFTGKQYSLADPTFPTAFLGTFRFPASSQDPRLSLLLLFSSRAPHLLQRTLSEFTKDSSFLTSANLLYRKHLPNPAVCSLLNKIQRGLHQRFYDFPSCPCCMARVLQTTKKEAFTLRHSDHILSIFRNRVLSQHPTWFVTIFKLLQTIWEQDLEDILSFAVLNAYMMQQNPIEFQIEFRDWMGAFLETPIVIEKILTGRISESNREFLQLWTGQPVNLAFVKRIQRARMEAWKEDLIIKTWHPDRLFTWCFDIEELKDFDFPEEES